MFSNVFLKTLFDMRKSLMWWSIGLFLMSLYMMTFYPSIEEGSMDMQEYVDNLPDSMKALIGGEVDLSTIEGFLSMELFSFFYPFMFLAFAVTYGASFIGSEEENGTLDLLLATPIPRWRVVLEKFAALVVFTLLVVAATYAGFMVGALLVDIDEMNAGRILEATLNMTPLTLFFAALALAMTGIRGGRGLALGVVLGLGTVSYLVYSMAEVTDIPNWLQQLSPWYYYNGIDVVKEGLNLGYLGLLIGLTALLIGVAMWGFERRDVGV
jgi:ABC-2 type transport system permease protein